ncbi:YeeE/YedE family protein [Caenimonas koreensis DSM 17982]|uniref:YeeE/YedE family protein n=1 Tax=Caenimonas koreensis DSM 17982 TaxID=1121255 RepID=A0A844B3N7_9BURK|nr:YeeE/YedE family protein [Caenimonas koreensis DSM 17982]
MLGLLFGAVGQWSRFCVRGAIADWVVFRGTSRFVSWMLAIAVAAIGTQLLVSLNLFDATRALAWSNRLTWVSCLVGGAIFGYGMVLAGGCPQRSLVKTGAGDLKALITLIVTAIAALMTLRGLFASPRVDALDVWSITLASPQDMGSLAALAGAPAPVVRWLLVAALAAFALALWWRHRATLDKSHWVGGIAVGLLVPAAWLITGHWGFLAEHPETLEPAWLGTQSRRPEGLSFVAPMGQALDLLTLWSDKNTNATFGITAALGVLIGSFVMAKLRGDFRLESFQNAKMLVSHLAGGMLMGFGGVTALGCTIGQGLTGLAMLSLGSVLTVGGIVAGAVAALRVAARHVESEAAA